MKYAVSHKRHPDAERVLVGTFESLAEAMATAANLVRESQQAGLASFTVSIAPCVRRTPVSDPKPKRRVHA